jgi:hypothetical protein
MRRNKSSLFSLAILSIIIIGLFSSINANAQEEEPTYSIGFDEGTELVWEVTVIDVLKFRDLFGFDANFEIADQIRIIVTRITEFSATWRVNYDFWDYKTDWSTPGEETELLIYNDGTNYDDHLFSLTPVEDYLTTVVSGLPSMYSVVSYRINKRGTTDVGKDYRWEKEYDRRGIPIVETYYNGEEEIVARVEGTFRLVSFGFYFVGFMLVVMIGVIIVSVKSKKFKYRY